MTGAAITQKSHPKLALCEPSIRFLSAPSSPGGEGYVLRIAAPGMEALEIAFSSGDEFGGEDETSVPASTSTPASLEDSWSFSSTTRSVRVCIACREGVSCSEEADEWFSVYLGTKCYFVKAKGTRNGSNPDPREQAGVTARGKSASQKGINQKPQDRITRDDRVGYSQVSLGSASFSNEAQFLILSLHSVQNLQHKVFFPVLCCAYRSQVCLL
jgi:hypothetical protein